MKKTLFLFLALVPAIALAQPIAGGTYTIPSTAYPTLADAVTALNDKGISGDVTFLLDANQTTTSSYVINSFTGSDIYTTTFRPNTGKNITISGNIESNFLIRLNNADRIVFDGNNGVADNMLTLYNTHNSNSWANRGVVWMYNNAQYCVLKNLVLKSNIIAPGQGVYLTGVMAGNASVGGQGNNLSGTISNNIFIGLNQAIFINGSSTSNNANWTITNNTIGASATSQRPYVGIYLANSNNYTISGNMIDGVLHSTTNGSHTYSATAIYATGGSNGIISGNTITNISNTTSSGMCFPIYTNTSSVTVKENAISNISSNSTNNNVLGGIYVDAANAVIHSNTIYSVITNQAKLNAGIYLNGNSGRIYNNMISNIVSAGGGDPASQTATGIYINAGSSIKVYFNSVRMETNQSTGASSCMFVNGGSSLDIRNNCFYNLQTSGSTRFAVYFNSPGSVGTLDANNYYSNQHIGSYGSYYTTANIKTSFADWKGATGMDASSISIIPPYTSASDLHLSADSGLDGAGIAIAGITTDIDGEIRATPPTIGADERVKCGGVPTTWNGSSWSNGAPYGSNASPSTQRAIIDGDYPDSAPSFRACELLVNSGKTLTIGEGKNVVVEYDIIINGSLVIENCGSLTQVSDAAQNTGNISLKRHTTPLKQYDYTYWSSPVAGTTLATTVNNGPTACYSYDAIVDNWQYQATSTVMGPGQGYIARAPNNMTFPNTGYTVTFSGNPNTGVVPVTVYQTATNGNNLIGNPYPSAINADAFILANRVGSGTINQSIDGNLYFWTHTLAISATNPNPGSGTYAYSADDYAVYNMSGGTSAAPSQLGQLSPVNPNGYIAAGQGFFINVIGTPGTKTVTFNNSMRVREDGQNGQFFRSAGHANATMSTPEVTIEKHRIWLNLTNTNGAFKQMLLAYVTGATNDYDYGYDGATLEAGNYISLYSILDDKKLSIQGRDANFTPADVVPIGIMTSIPGTFQLSIDQVDGFFAEGQSVYLLDKLTNTMVNLMDQKYEFETAVGTFDDRFELRFSESALDVNLPPVVKNSVSVYAANGRIEVSATKDIQSLVVYDLTGRQLYSKTDLKAREFATETLTARSQVVIAKVTTADGSECVKKLQIR